METVNQTSFIDLPELTRDEKREIWLRRTGNTLKLLAGVAGVSVSTLSLNIRNNTMPVRQHETLVAYGVPPQILPDPMDQKPGPKPSLPALVEGAPYPVELPEQPGDPAYP